jgi:hypothetical protein
MTYATSNLKLFTSRLVMVPAWWMTGMGLETSHCQLYLGVTARIKDEAEHILAESGAGQRLGRYLHLARAPLPNDVSLLLAARLTDAARPVLLAWEPAQDGRAIARIDGRAVTVVARWKYLRGGPGGGKMTIEPEAQGGA